VQAKEARTGVKIKLSQGEAKKRIAKGTSGTRVEWHNRKRLDQRGNRMEMA
jgi:hypothetical protein